MHTFFKLSFFFLAFSYFIKYEITHYKCENNVKNILGTENYNKKEIVFGKNIDKECTNKHKMCSEWALVGECDSNPNFMLEKCHESCRVCQSERCYDKLADCEQLVKEHGCYTKNMKDDCRWSCSSCDVLKNVKQCIRNPEHKPAISENTTDDLFRNLINNHGAISHSSESWVVTLDNVIPQDECDKIVKNIKSEHWNPSLIGDGKTNARTSSTYWCESVECRHDTKILRNWVNEKLNVPDKYAEPLQLLRYKEGEYYKPHHDQNSPRSSAWGPRIYTVFFYLSDVEEGGETFFTKLNITIKPKKGSIIVWSNIINEDPNKRDENTFHESLTVSKGTKFSANYWIHLYPYKFYVGCDNKAYYENWY